MVNINKEAVYDEKDYQSVLKKLGSSIAYLTESDESVSTLIPGLCLYRQANPTQMVTALYESSICVVIQGTKRVFLGKENFIYDSNSYLLSTVNLPATVQVIKATPKNPYLGLVLKLDRREISQIMIDGTIPSTSSMGQPDRGMATGKMTFPLLAAFKRLIDLINTPKDIPVLAPLIQREIIYRLLTGEQGARLRQVVLAGSQSHLIAKVIDWIKANFTDPLSIDDLTEKASMSASTFHHHFRSLTAMSPIQYIKTLRLYEARRLMLAESYDAATASFTVGYESPSQFNREYKRQFGDSPVRDIKKLNGELVS